MYCLPSNLHGLYGSLNICIMDNISSCDNQEEPLDLHLEVVHVRLVQFKEVNCLS